MAKRCRRWRIRPRLGAAAIALSVVMAMMFMAAGAGKVQAAPPERVVSINLCTDQLAMLLAAPAQLLSVSHLARDSASSSMVEQAQRYAINHGRAEEIALLAPDLVLAGTFTTKTTLMMLRSLGYRIEQFAPDRSVADIAANLERMGRLLGREAEAAAIITAMEQDLREIQALGPRARPVTALAYYAGGYTAGADGLESDILRLAGARNIAPDLGFGYGGVMSLEALVLASPQLLVHSGLYAQSRMQDLLAHPALSHRRDAPYLQEPTTPAWTCGTPHTIAVLRRLAHRLAQEQNR